MYNARVADPSLSRPILASWKIQSNPLCPPSNRTSLDEASSCPRSYIEMRNNSGPGLTQISFDQTVQDYKVCFDDKSERKYLETVLEPQGNDTGLRVNWRFFQSRPPMSAALQRLYDHPSSSSSVDRLRYPSRSADLGCCWFALRLELAGMFWSGFRKGFSSLLNPTAVRRICLRSIY